jgi:prepilin-type N-terminal cleavage/methylation domain-containing protein
MKKAFTLIEVLVVVGIISLLLALSLPVMRRAREQGDETVCQSNLRQLAIILKTCTNESDGLFSRPTGLFHSTATYWPPHDEYKPYPTCCRWHDARIGLDSSLLRHELPEARGSLWPYLGDTRIVRCEVGRRANTLRGCNNTCDYCAHNPGIDIIPQFTYCMNAYLGATLTTGRSASGSVDDAVDSRTIRQSHVRRETQVTRSPSDVFVFGEGNSWAINTEGRQPIAVRPQWAAPYNLSGKYYLEKDPHGCRGTIRFPSLSIRTTYELSDGLTRVDDRYLGDAFATCHRPRRGDLNTGHSYVVMLDGHTQKVTVADQLRRSRQVPYLEGGRLGPGGNLALAWPLQIPPPGGWENQ